MHKSKVVTSTSIFKRQQYSGGGSITTEQLQQRIEVAETEILKLLKQLTAKRFELMELTSVISENKELEAEFDELFIKVFKWEPNLSFDLEKGVTVLVGLRHTAAQKLIDVLAPMTDSSLTIKMEVDHTGYNESVIINFPYEKLKSVIEGLKLSKGVDLSSDQPTLVARC